MPALCGIFHRQNQPVALDYLQKSIQFLPHCGVPPQFHVHKNSGVAGCCQTQDNLYIVADVRLDNRPELLRLLDLTHSPVSDPALILACFQKWGTHCPEYLLGDFAFCIVDTAKQQLFCARDHFGVRPFYYTLKDHFFGFASEIKGLLCFSQVSNRLNDIRIAEYLSAIVMEPQATFYTDIVNLPPGHRLSVTPRSHSLEQYYQFQPSPLAYHDDQTYADQFYDIFKSAVGCRIQGKHNGFLLSGGLDSSSIVCVAKEQYQQEGRGAVDVYSGIFDRIADCDEQQYIKPVLNQGNYNWQTVYGDELDLFGVLPEMARCQDEPWFAPHMFMLWELLGVLKQNGAKVLVDGHDGDTTVSHGWCHLNNLIQDWRLPALWQEAKHIKAVHGQSMARDLLFLLYRQKIRTPLAKTPLLGSLVRCLKRQGRHVPEPVATQGLSLLAPAFRESVQLESRLIQFHERHCRSNLRESDDHVQAVFQPLQPFALEVLGRSVRHFGMEYHCPFWDKRLVEFCLNLPSDQKFKKGYSRSILRRAMQGVLPEEVRLRPGKTDFTPNLCHSFAKNNGHVLAEYLRKSRPLVGKWVDMDAVSTYSNINKKFSPSTIPQIWKVVTLAAWVQTRDT